MVGELHQQITASRREDPLRPALLQSSGREQEDMRTTEVDVDALYSKVQKRLVESGEWDRICLLLSYKLNNAGWVDDVRNQSKEHARAMEPLSLRQLIEHVGPRARAAIPESVRADIMTAIRKFLDEQFES
ncbi:hypothetical protein EWM64_g10064 [Hericium alpestre]|uniref:Transcription and mRNA export factor SUS1 n=1 Tax=Hericium alpestre TaxID=135208 RepID=A0A4Y9ZJX2_9AGAM|nr:hypothetical protein EWM64_g10064 [Hericium alpestre]